MERFPFKMPIFWFLMRKYNFLIIKDTLIHKTPQFQQREQSLNCYYKDKMKSSPLTLNGDLQRHTKIFPCNRNCFTTLLISTCVKLFILLIGHLMNWLCLALSIYLSPSFPTGHFANRSFDELIFGKTALDQFSAGKFTQNHFLYSKWGMQIIFFKNSFLKAIWQSC